DLIPNVITYQEEFIIAFQQTLYMVLISGLIAFILGYLIAIVMLLFSEPYLYQNKIVFSLIDKLVNLLRAIPFIILIALLMPFTRLLVGSAIGVNGAIVPLVFGIAPFFAKQIYNMFKEVNYGLIEAGLSMGLSPGMIIYHIYVKENIIATIRIIAFSLISLVGLSAMAGAVGGGGLGSLAIDKGFNRFMMDIVVVATILILVIVYTIQLISNIIVSKIKY
ncbi:MAG: methionine ABC transporter permease, partial [Bacilli bacterium]